MRQLLKHGQHKASWFEMSQPQPQPPPCARGSSFAIFSLDNSQLSAGPGITSPCRLLRRRLVDHTTPS